MDTYQKKDKTLCYQIVYKKIKNTYFRVKDDCVVITTNRLVSKKQILLYLEEKFDKFHHIITNQRVLDSNHHIQLWGKTYDLHVHHGRFAYVIDELKVSVTSMSENIKDIKKRIYQQEMNKRLVSIHEDVIFHIKYKGINQLPIKLKYLKSKFGSYHRKHHEITLNTFLATLDEIYLYYVLFHEYAHVIVFNHSKDFYNLLGEFMPNHRIYQKDLKKIAII
ncbi:MAG: DUF45 domain-containing protein [Acholeplasmataceae bacterium]|jgi:predicted metal-dependent hydrolase|nr:DUF45 domain-containing protein [Acholeplasmataceae bacterium]